MVRMFPRNIHFRITIFLMANPGLRIHLFSLLFGISSVERKKSENDHVYQYPNNLWISKPSKTKSLGLLVPVALDHRFCIIIKRRNWVMMQQKVKDQTYLSNGMRIVLYEVISLGFWLPITNSIWYMAGMKSTNLYLWCVNTACPIPSSVCFSETCNVSKQLLLQFCFYSLHIEKQYRSIDSIFYLIHHTGTCFVSV